jgi:hypothetical protein
MQSYERLYGINVEGSITQWAAVIITASPYSSPIFIGFLNFLTINPVPPSVNCTKENSGIISLFLSI